MTGRTRARRRLVLLAAWLVFVGLGYALRHYLFDEPAGDALRAAVLQTTLWPLAFALGQRLRAARRAGSDDEVSGSWRTYDGGKWSRWRHGWLRHAGGVVVAIPAFGETKTRVGAASVASVAERAPTRREQWSINATVRVVEVTLADGGRVDFAAMQKDLPDLRRWLGPGGSPDVVL